MLSSGFIGGSGALYRLEQQAWTCHGILADPAQRAVCAAIANLLDRVAKRQEGQAVTANEEAALCSALSQPLMRATDYLIAVDSGVTSTILVADLTDEYDKWVAAYSKT
jgi:hypothetical protein